MGLFRAAAAAFLFITAMPGASNAQEAKDAPTPDAPLRTQVDDSAALVRLIGNSGVTLQWIGWEQRGTLGATYQDGVLRLIGGQADPHGKGRLEVDGVVTRIGPDYFWFTGRIAIIDTPDSGRFCERDGEMSFRITQNRKYWRLQEMEVCDGLTDYVDVYF